MTGILGGHHGARTFPTRTLIQLTKSSDRVYLVMASYPPTPAIYSTSLRACAKPRTRTRTADWTADSGQRTADSGQRTAASTFIETRHSESLITVWTAQRHVPCWAHLPFMKGQDDTIIVRRLQAVCVGVVSVRLVLN